MAENEQNGNEPEDPKKAEENAAATPENQAKIAKIRC